MAAINNNIKTYYLFYVNFGSLFSYQWEKCKFLWVFYFTKIMLCEYSDVVL